VTTPAQWWTRADQRNGARRPLVGPGLGDRGPVSGHLLTGCRCRMTNSWLAGSIGPAEL